MAVKLPDFWSSIDAVLFDLDGVLTPTASIHERAWAQLFAEFEYTDSDYLSYIDGKPRFEGVKSFLDSRGIVIEEGAVDDPPGTSTVTALGNKKNQLFLEILERDQISAFEGSVAFCDYLITLGVEQAVVSSSRNAVTVLKAAGMIDRFEVIVDGMVAADRGLGGKPKPDTFLYGAERLGVDPRRTAVVEDATVGVKAARAGSFGVVIGVDRGAGSEALLQKGADLVVDDLAELIDEGVNA